MSLPDGAMVVSEVHVVRYLHDDEDVIVVDALDGGGNTLPLVEALGLLRFAEDDVIRERMDGAA